jgi:hypothetical protein
VFPIREFSTFRAGSGRRRGAQENGDRGRRARPLSNSRAAMAWAKARFRDLLLSKSHDLTGMGKHSKF